MTTQHSINLFKTKTFWGGVIGLLAGIMIPVVDIAFDKKVTKENIIVIGTAVIGFTGVVIGRTTADKPAHTSHGLPGADKENFIPESEKTIGE